MLPIEFIMDLNQIKVTFKLQTFFAIESFLRPAPYNSLSQSGVVLVKNKWQSVK